MTGMLRSINTTSGRSSPVLLQRFLAIRRFRNHLQSWLGREERRDSGSDEVVIVGREDPNRCRHSNNDMQY